MSLLQCVKNQLKISFKLFIVKLSLLNFVNLFTKNLSQIDAIQMFVTRLLLSTSHYQINNFKASTRITDNIYYPLKQEERFKAIYVCVTSFKAMITVKYEHNWILHCIGFHLYSGILALVLIH